MLFILLLLALSGCAGDSSLPFYSPPGASFDPDASHEKVRSAAIRSADRELVERFLAKVKVGTVTEVKGQAPSQCGDTSYAYEAARLADGAHINLRLGVKFKPEDVQSERRIEMLDALNACVPKLQETWARYGIKLSVELGASNPHNTIVVIDEEGRSDSNDIFFRGRPGSWVQDELCLTLLHETGHHLGFRDEYFEEGTCRTKETASTDAEPWSVMDSQDHGWDHIEFFPRHVRQMLEQAMPPQRLMLTVVRETRFDAEVPGASGLTRYVGGHIWQKGEDSVRNPSCLLIGTFRKNETGLLEQGLTLAFTEQTEDPPRMEFYEGSRVYERNFTATINSPLTSITELSLSCRSYREVKASEIGAILGDNFQVEVEPRL